MGSSGDDLSDAESQTTWLGFRVKTYIRRGPEQPFGCFLLLGDFQTFLGGRFLDIAGKQILNIAGREILGEIADGVHDPHPLFCELSEIRFMSSKQLSRSLPQILLLRCQSWWLLGRLKAITGSGRRRRAGWSLRKMSRRFFSIVNVNVTIYHLNKDQTQFLHFFTIFTFFFYLHL